MTAVSRYLYPVAAPRSVPEIIAWWERRRVVYNVVVGATGIVSLGVMALFSALPPSRSFDIPWFAPIIYGAMANLCYTFGWSIESVLHVVWRDEVRPVGPLLFRQGLAFAVGLTSLPIVLAGVEWAFRVVRALL